jgi:23S rRNA pseudouridine2605 synthase
MRDGFARGRPPVPAQDRIRGRARADPPGAGVRLQKVLAQAGVGSRRACEQLIAQGRVEVDGRVVTEQGVRVDPTSQVIRVDGSRIVTSPDLVHLAFNKPAGVVSTMNDPQGRPSLGDYVGDRRDRLFHVGRLDADTEGLILLTNDGELAHRLAHPRYEVKKTYVAEVRGPVGKDVGRRLRAGVELEDGVAVADSFRLVGSSGSRVMIEIVVHEGRNRIVRRMLAAVGHPVERLVRTQIGPVALGSLRPGKLRPLTRDELSRLYTKLGL